MSNYQELKGLKIKYLSVDTSGDRIQEVSYFITLQFQFEIICGLALA